MSKILVTGGAGFIGSHLTDVLVQEGHTVFVMDNLSTGRKEYVNPRARFYELDIRSPQAKNFVVSERFEAIFHLAAQIDVRKSAKDPLTDADINIMGSLNILEAAKVSGVKRFVFSSTGGAMYGQTEQRPTSENYPATPITPYGIGKLAIEHYLQYFRDLFGLSSISLRYSNVYGPRQNSQGEAGVVAIFSDRCLRGKPLQINGDGKQTRDYVYVDDVIKANLLALASNSCGQYNIATGVETDVNAIARLIQESANKKSRIYYGPPRQGDIYQSCLDASRFKKEFAWKAVIDVNEGIRRTVEWFLRNAPYVPSA